MAVNVLKSNHLASLGLKGSNGVINILALNARERFDAMLTCLAAR